MDLFDDGASRLHGKKALLGMARRLNTMTLPLSSCPQVSAQNNGPRNYARPSVHSFICHFYFISLATCFQFSVSSFLATILFKLHRHPPL